MRMRLPGARAVTLMLLSSGIAFASNFRSTGTRTDEDARFERLINLVFLLLFTILAVVGYWLLLRDDRNARAGARRGRWRDLHEALAALREDDPRFSVPIFLEFLLLLYVRLQVQRGRHGLAVLSPYVSPSLLTALREGTPKALKEVTNVLVGSMRIAWIQPGSLESTTRVRVTFLASYRESTGTAESSYTVEESWTLARDRSVRSRPPERISVLGCPSCGSPGEPSGDGRCASCGRVAQAGRLDWSVTSIEVIRKVHATPPDLTGVQGGGAELPTVFAPTLRADWRSFHSRHADFDLDDFKRVVTAAFLRLHKALSEQSWERARPIETDHLFSMHRYWIEQYQAAGMTNRIEDVHVGKIELVDVAFDAYYEAITVRVHASGLDYTVDRTGTVLSGSQTKPRPFSEYWTLIRRIGHQGRPKDVSGSCPACAAPLQIGMAGLCEHCHAKVTTGDFGWVVSSIEPAAQYGR